MFEHVSAALSQCMQGVVQPQSVETINVRLRSPAVVCGLLLASKSARVAAETAQHVIKAPIRINVYLPLGQPTT